MAMNGWSLEPGPKEWWCLSEPHTGGRDIIGKGNTWQAAIDDAQARLTEKDRIKP